MVEQEGQQHHQAKMDSLVTERDAGDEGFYQQTRMCLETNDGNDEKENGNGRGRKDFEKHEPKIYGGAPTGSNF